MRKFYLFFIFSFLTVFVYAQGNLFDLVNTQSSVYAKYIGGKEIINKNADWRLNAASVSKLFTTASALDLLGQDYTFETKIYFSGIKSGSKLKGDIYIVGGGDPSLASRYSDESLEEIVSAWAGAVKRRGIKKITGNIYSDNTLFKGETLPIFTTYENIGNYFAAPADALTIKDNSFTLYFEPSLTEGSLGKIAKIVPEEYLIPIVVKAYHTKAVSREDSYFNFVNMQDKMEITGKLPLTSKKTPVLGAMANPALFAAHYFKIKLEEQGIKVKGQAALGSKEEYLKEDLVFKQVSVPLKEIVKKTNKRSINLYADILLRHLGKGSLEEGIKAVGNYLTKLNIDSSDTTLYDGSGLARGNLTTCKTIVNLLEQVLKQPYKEDFIDSLPIVGDEGDMGNMSCRMKNTLVAGKARIKTGTLNGVRAHAGYIWDKNDKQIAFCVISNNYSVSKNQIDTLQEEIILKLAEGEEKKPKNQKDSKTHKSKKAVKRPSKK